MASTIVAVAPVREPADQSVNDLSRLHSHCIIQHSINIYDEYQSAKSTCRVLIICYQRGMLADKPVASRARRQRSEPAQQALFKPRGGKRRGAGRKPKGLRAGSPHKVRPELSARYPVHVSLRVVNAVGNLRRRCAYQAIREATLTTARREDFRIYMYYCFRRTVDSAGIATVATRWLQECREA